MNVINLEKQKEFFKNHVATLTDLGNIKILDFKEPNTCHYRIRFLFEEDYYYLHISGDLGELTAYNYGNMTYEGFDDFIDNHYYFYEKIITHSRAIFQYDEDKTEEKLREIIESNNKIKQTIIDKYSYYDSYKDEAIDDFIGSVLEDFSEETGLSQRGLELANETIQDFYLDYDDIGEYETGILDLYFLAFKLAKKQLERRD